MEQHTDIRQDEDEGIIVACIRMGKSVTKAAYYRTKLMLVAVLGNR